MTFRIGQKVVCVNDSIPLVAVLLRWALRYPWMLRKNQTYTVERVLNFHGLPVVALIEVKNPPTADSAFRADRFRPIVERKTSIEIFTAMLKPSKVDA